MKVEIGGGRKLTDIMEETKREVKKVIIQYRRECRDRGKECEGGGGEVRGGKETVMR